MSIVIFKITEAALFPITLLSAIWMKFLTMAGLDKSILAEKIFFYFGVLPIRDHYYEPLINPKKHLTKSLREDRVLKSLDFNIEFQLSLLNHFSFNEELKTLPVFKKIKNMNFSSTILTIVLDQETRSFITILYNFLNRIQ